jgi:hypothetical protein
MNRWKWIIFFFIVIHGSLAAQTLTSIVLPKFIQGNTGINSNRIPFVYRARLNGLLPHTVYRYYNQVVLSTDAATANGAGNCIFASLTGDFFRTGNPGLKTAGNYDSLTTDGTGAYEGWFVTEPTGNGKFAPGMHIFMRIVLNDGSGGSSAVTRLTTADSVRVIKLDPAFTDSTGTGLRCTSTSNPKDFIFIYDNEEGFDRPVTGSFVENDGTENSAGNNYAAFYANQVNNINGAFGALLPNILPNGVRSIVRRSLATGAINGLASDADGTWPSGVKTINPSGGTTELVFAGTDLHWTTAVESSIHNPHEFTVFQNYPNPFNPETRISYSLNTNGLVRLSVYDVGGREVATLVNEEKSAGKYEVKFTATNLSCGIYFYRFQVQRLSGEKEELFSETKKLVLLK